MIKFPFKNYLPTSFFKHSGPLFRSQERQISFIKFSFRKKIDPNPKEYNIKFVSERELKNTCDKNFKEGLKRIEKAKKNSFNKENKK